jgi:ADP-ribose pyrophosphatase YjhB (NUDIX family)
MPPKLYVEDPEFMMPLTFLSEEVYEQALSSLIVVCADTVIIDREHKTLWLAKRIVPPISTDWVIGGRIGAGEKEQDGAQRIFARETSLNLPRERFSFLGMNRYICSERKQYPQEKGSDTLSYTFIAELTPEEIQIVSKNLEPQEYDLSAGLTEFSRTQLVERKVHRAIIDMYDLIFPHS